MNTAGMTCVCRPCNWLTYIFTVESAVWIHAPGKKAPVSQGVQWGLDPQRGGDEGASPLVNLASFSLGCTRQGQDNGIHEMDDAEGAELATGSADTDSYNKGLTDDYVDTGPSVKKYYSLNAASKWPYQMVSFIRLIVYTMQFMAFKLECRLL